MKKLTIFFLIFSFLFSIVVMAQSEITPPKKTQKTTVAKQKTATKNTTPARRSSEPTRYIPAGYVDLGLPSGTLWKDVNETNPSDYYGFYTYGEALNVFGSSLPTKAQWQELKNRCRWIWDNSKRGYNVIGNNGNFIFLPAAGDRPSLCSPGGIGKRGGYWSSTRGDSDGAWMLLFEIDMDELRLFNSVRSYGFSVRLVYN